MQIVRLKTVLSVYVQRLWKENSSVWNTSLKKLCLLFLRWRVSCKWVLINKGWCGMFFAGEDWCIADVSSDSLSSEQTILQFVGFTAPGTWYLYDYFLEYSCIVCSFGCCKILYSLWSWSLCTDILNHFTVHLYIYSVTNESLTQLL